MVAQHKLETWLRQHTHFSKYKQLELLEKIHIQRWAVYTASRATTQVLDLTSARPFFQRFDVIGRKQMSTWCEVEMQLMGIT